jgi:hypothetical protein
MLALSISSLSLLVLAAGCNLFGDDDDGCTPGETQSCACSGGEQGAQTCADDGASWGACDCDGVGGGDAGASPDALEGGDGAEGDDPSAGETGDFVCDEAAHSQFVDEQHATADLSRYVEIDTSCYPTGVDDGTVLAGVVRGDPSARTGLTLVWQNGALVSLDGMACEPVHPGLQKSPVLTSIPYECEIAVACGCCSFRVSHDIEGETVLIEGVGYTEDEECGLNYRADWRFSYGESTGVSGSGGSSSGNDACDSCLHSCEGLFSCCMGTGCICEDACALGQARNCSPPTYRCCGPDGFCLCLENCPY